MKLWRVKNVDDFGKNRRNTIWYSSQVNYLEGLNERQKEAVLSTEGAISVLAGAGSGKTKVLTTRIYHLIRQGVPPEQILAVTFTNKAAREMKERLGRMLGEEFKVYRQGHLPLVATFHGLGKHLLEQYGSVMGISRSASILDRDESKAIVRDILKGMDIDPKELSPGFVLGAISKAKGDGLTPERFREQFGQRSFRTRVVSEVWPRYEKKLREEKALDFDDLITLPVTLLRDHPEVREEVQKRFSHIHVDEYQDTSELQGNLARMLAEKHGNLFVVGDIDQTIYTWRGATIENLLAFDENHPSAKTIVLEHNYRSTKTIVDAANQIIEKNQNRKEKTSVTDNAEGERITLYSGMNAEDEARYVAREAKKRLRDGTPPEEICVLFRANFQSRALEEAFLSESVPYKLLGTRFFERKEVKDVISWTRLALDPSREADRMRAVQAPSRGIGKVTLGKLSAGKRDELRAADRVKVEVFESIVAGLVEAAKIEIPSQFVKLIIEKTGLESALLKEGEEGMERLENIKELATLASRYDAFVGEEGLLQFLNDAALAGDQDELDRTEQKGVTLMTVHAAKGLEFDVVFVTGLEEGLFPHEGREGEERDEEEERRLFYVAVTRAKRKLYLTMARVRRIYGTDYLATPSSFLNDIGAGLVELAPNAYERNEFTIHI
ncbi:MAG: DNA helicase II / ATP-dependent DNA helicase PcrA [Parcubacteria bacterium C7867-001]|nr:MAG: DNA helicase II / ATP-dependent DNA helicase PcrA [Parcubacteria bacterium C7867-001]